MSLAKRFSDERAFTIPEVIVAGFILIIICIGTAQTFTFATRINRGNNLRMQALSVLQREVEEFRSFKFTPLNPDVRLAGGDYPNYKVGGAAPVSADGRAFNISVTIDNDVNTAGIQTGNEGTTTFKEITIRAVPQVAENEGWLQNLGTEVTIQRVRSN